MYKSRFTKWGIGKYTSKQDWQAFVILKDRARAAGIDLRQVQIHNRIRNLPELERYLRKQEISEEDFLNEAIKAGASVPDHVRSIPAPVSSAEQTAAVDGVWTPIGHSCDSFVNETLNSLPTIEGVELPLFESSFNNAQGLPHDHSNKFEGSQLQHHDPQSCPQGDAPRESHFKHHDHPQSCPSGIPPELTMYLAQAVNPMSGIMPIGPSYVDLSAMAEQISTPYQAHVYHNHGTREIDVTHGTANLSVPSFQSLAQARLESVDFDGAQDLRQNRQLSSADDLSSALHMPVPGSVPDPTAQYVQTEEHHAFMGYVFMACMSDAAGVVDCDVDLREFWMDQASLKLRVMCVAQDPMLLVTVHTILVWLQVHDTDSRAESLIGDLSRETEFELGKDSSIAVTLQCMTAAAGKKLPNSPIGLDTLRRVVHEFGAEMGPNHPHTLVALYYMCFHMLLVHRRFAEAEEELRKLYNTTSNILGKSSFLAVCVLGTLSRAQSRQNKHHAALDTVNQCIQEAPLGLNHPHRLELLSRKALICGHLKDKLKPEEDTERLYWDAMMERLHWTVVRGRVATLGGHHSHTQAAHETLLETLTTNGRWELMKGEVQELLTKPQVAVSSYESWWQSKVPRDRDGDVKRAWGESTE